jgi:hypothetical protein
MHHEEVTNCDWELQIKMNAKRESSDSGREILMPCITVTLVQG